MARASESILVYREGDTYRAVRRITRDAVAEGSSASEVIQAAADASTPGGGRITLEAGTFLLDASIRLATGVHLAGQGRATRLCLSARNSDRVGILAESANFVTVADLAVMPGDCPDGRAGVVLHDCGDSKVERVLCAGFAGDGIVVREGSFLCEVSGCRLAGNAGAGIHLHDLRKGRAGDYIPNTIRGCTVYGGGVGIECDRAIVVNVLGCTVYQSKDTAYLVHDDSNSVLVSGCRSFQITGSALVAEASHELNVSSNIFCWHTSHGIRVRDCRWGTICGNEVIDSGSYNPGAIDQTVRMAHVADRVVPCDGIRLEGVHGYNVTGNTVFNWPQGTRLAAGIRENASSRKNVLTGNNCNYFSEAGVVSEGPESLVSANVAQGAEPHVGSSAYEYCQSFRTELTDALIADLL